MEKAVESVTSPEQILLDREEQDIFQDAPDHHEGSLTFRELQEEMRTFLHEEYQLENTSDLIYNATKREERSVQKIREYISLFLEKMEDEGVHLGTIEWPYDHETLEEALFEETYGLSFLQPYFKRKETEGAHLDGDELFISRYLEGEKREEEILIDPESVEALQDRMGRLQNLQLHAGQPSAETFLADGTRVVMIIPPEASTRQIIVRRFNIQQPTYDLLAEEFGTFPAGKEWRRFFELYMRARLHLLIIGPPDSGKTTTLKALFAMKREEDGVVTIEPHFEAHLKKTFRRKRKGKIIELQKTGKRTYEELFERGLRSNVRCLIVPEVRSFAEASIFIRAMERGLHGCICTFHTSEAEQVPTLITDLAQASQHMTMIHESRVSRHLHGVMSMNVMLDYSRKMTGLSAFDGTREVPVVRWKGGTEWGLARRTVPESWEPFICTHLSAEEETEFRRLFRTLPAAEEEGA